MSDLQDQLEDDIEDEEDEEYNDAEDDSRPEPSKKRKNMFIDDDAEEASDEGDEDDKVRKEKRRRGNQFVDDMADVQDDDEEDFEDDEEEPGARFIDEGEDEGKELNYNRVLDARNRERARNEEVDEQEIEEHYARLAQQPVYQGEGGEDDVVNQHSLLPSWNDPTKLWMVKCQDRQERQCVTQLMQKFINMQLKGQKLPIKAAFCLDSLSGWFYIEAEKESGVRDAINGMRGVIRTKAPTLVPVEEMTDAIAVKNTARSDLAVGSWVRVQSGVYKHDLAMLEDIDPAGTKVVIKVVPRIDYAAIIKRKQDREQGIKAAPFGGANQGGVRVPAAPFNKQEAEANGQYVEERYGSGKQMIYILNGTRQFADGYELKTVAQRAVKPEPSPPFEEMQRYMNAAVGGGGVDDAALLAAGSKKATVYSKGDKVEVTNGDLRSMKGEVIEVTDNGMVWVKPDIVGFTEKLEFPATDLRKHIANGTHVKVVSGAHHVGELGMVNVVTEDGVAMVLLDSTQKEIKVLVNNLTETLETNSGLESFGQYSLHQAVLLTDNTVGMIINISPETCSVLTNSGAANAPVRQCRLQDIKRGLETRRLPAADCNNSRVAVESMVDVVDGPYRGKVGTVKHVWKMHVWIKCRDITQNGGFLVAFAKHTRLRGSGKASAASNGFMAPRTPSRLNPASPAYGALRSPAHPSMSSYESGLQSPRHGDYNSGSRGGGDFGGRGGGRGGFGGRGRGHVEDSLVNQRVKVVTGGYRGYRGLVQYATDTHVRMELDATNKVITIERNRVRLDDVRLQQRAAPQFRDSHFPPPTPSRGLLHAETPDVGMPAATPGFADTPAYGMAAGTPGTAYTPGTNMMAMTPAMTPGTNVAATPSMTPGTVPMSPAMDAPTPYGASAATPGTGALGTAMTPGFGMTPGGMTPGTLPGATPAVDAWSPGYGDGESDETLYPHWTDLHVTFGDDEHGVVTSYNADTGEFTMVRGEQDEQGALQLSETQVVLPADRVTLVIPSKKDKVKIVGGDAQNVGQVGELIGVDNEDGIVKTEKGEIAILLLRDIGRLSLT